MPGEVSTIGSYRVIRPLGEGGMGAVYEVEHPQLGVHYALKTFVLDHGNAELLRQRFLAEGKTLARLKHPNLVRVHDLGFDEATGNPYFVMDLVLSANGEPYTLADFGPGDAEEEYLVVWYRQLASALEYIHANGIVHRDIKPNNLLLDESGGIVLSDFGVSRFFGEQIRSEVSIRNTMSMVSSAGRLIMGTAGFIAPEVERGEEATPAADYYAMGMVFYRLLTGMWYEHNATAEGLLEGFEYDWKAVLLPLLSEAPGERTVKLPEKAASEAEDAGGPKDSKRTAASGRIVWLALGIAAVLAAAAGIWKWSGKPVAEDSERTVEGSEVVEEAFAIPEGVQ